MKKKILINSIIALIFYLIIASVVVSAIYQHDYVDRKDYLRTKLLNITSQLEYSINSSFLIVYSVATNFSLREDLTAVEFNELASQLFTRYHNLRNVALAKNYTIMYAYPVEGNEAIIGLDYKTIPEQFAQVSKARTEKKMILDGPLNLVQGGKGLIARVPVFNESDEFLGIVSSVLNFETILEPINSVANENDLKFSILDKSLGKDSLLAGDPNLFTNKNFVEQDIVLPDRVWTINVSFIDNRIFSIFKRVSIILILLIIYLIIELIIINNIRNKFLLNKHTKRFEDFSKTSTNWIWEIDENYNFIYSEGELSKECWLERNFILNRNFLDIFMSPDYTKISESIENILNSHKRIISKEWWIINRKNEQLCFTINALPIFEEEKFIGYRGVSTDVTEKRKSEQELMNYLELVDTYIPITQTDLDGNITKVNSAYCKLSGYNEEELIGHNHRIMKHPATPPHIFKDLWQTIKDGKTWKGEYQNIKKDGGAYWCSSHIKPIQDIFKVHYGYMAVRQDITAEKELKRISETDQLTRIYNRRKLDETLSKELNVHLRTKHPLSLIMLDIDHFKKCNDVYGHLIGDEVLKSVSEIMSSNIRITDIVGRWGGEEFIIICPDTNGEGAVKLAESLRIKIEDKNFSEVGRLTCSFGVASTSDNIDINNITGFADEALYLAKESGRNCVKRYEKNITH